MFGIMVAEMGFEPNTLRILSPLPLPVGLLRHISGLLPLRDYNIANNNNQIAAVNYRDTCYLIVETLD